MKEEKKTQEETEETTQTEDGEVVWTKQKSPIHSNNIEEEGDDEDDDNKEADKGTKKITRKKGKKKLAFNDEVDINLFESRVKDSRKRKVKRKGKAPAKNSDKCSALESVIEERIKQANEGKECAKCLRKVVKTNEMATQCPVVNEHFYCTECSKEYIINQGGGRAHCPSGRMCKETKHKKPWVFTDPDVPKIWQSEEEEQETIGLFQLETLQHKFQNNYEKDVANMENLLSRCGVTSDETHDSTNADIAMSE